MKHEAVLVNNEHMIVDALFMEADDYVQWEDNRVEVVYDDGQPAAEAEMSTHR